MLAHLTALLTAHLVPIVLYAFPILAVLIARVLQPRRAPNPRLFPALLLSTLWVFVTIPVLQRLNQHFLWWSFEGLGPRFLGMPIDAWFGWTILWGLLPQLAFPALGLTEIIIFFAAIDLWLMPFIHVIAAHDNWMYGETLALAFILVPALLLMRRTLQNRWLCFRGAMQVALSGLIFFYFVPELVFTVAPRNLFGGVSSWQPLLSTKPFVLQLAIQLIVVLAIPGMSAVQEFSRRGGGTPIPYDPPIRLVTSGIYRYCANPMQLACTAAMAVWALLLHNLWLGVGCILIVIYSAGLATWDEHVDLARRFGVRWQLYRKAVPAWRLRWRPYHAGPPAKLYVSATCAQCSQVRRWLEARSPIGLTFIDAETLPAGSIRRLRYDPADGTPTEHGVAAMARALEHCNLFWAWCGFTLRMPLLAQLLQLAADTVGFGPRHIPSTCPREF